MKSMSSYLVVRLSLIVDRTFKAYRDLRTVSCGTAASDRLLYVNVSSTGPCCLWPGSVTVVWKFPPLIARRRRLTPRPIPQRNITAGDPFIWSRRKCVFRARRSFQPEAELINSQVGLIVHDVHHLSYFKELGRPKSRRQISVLSRKYHQL